MGGFIQLEKLTRKSGFCFSKSSSAETLRAYTYCVLDGIYYTCNPYIQIPFFSNVLL